MRSLYIIGGPLRRATRIQPSKILKRYKFIGTPDHIRKPLDETARAGTLLPTTPARTRFAPSPTGYLHLGSLRTALYNYLLAKATGGQFLLRLEDTDQSRLVKDAEPRLYEDLKWAGLSWDEGPDIGGPFGPYKQSERLSKYHVHADKLINSGQAYRCFCTPEELDTIKRYNMEHADDGHSNYNGKCRHIHPTSSQRRADNGEKHCVRFKVNNTYMPLVNDLVYGKWQRPGVEDDFILIKRDGFPTYHFANVVDDHLMEITHVVRGAEWLISTPRHVMLYDAFGWTLPTFAHVGLLCNQQGQKLSKRQGDIDIASFRDQGILPVALLNYAVLLGWSPGRGEKGTSEVMDLNDMIEKFHLRFTKGDIRISNKQEFIQNKHMTRMMATLTSETFEDLILPGVRRAMNDVEMGTIRDAPETPTRIGPLVSKAQPQTEKGGAVVSSDYIYKVVELDKNTYTNAQKYVLRNMYLIWEVPVPIYAETLGAAMKEVISLYLRAPNPTTDPDNPDANNKFIETTSSPSDLVSRFHSLLSDIPTEEWTQDRLEPPVTALIKTIYAHPTTGPPNAWGFHMLRWILCAMKSGPALVPSMVVLGRKEVMRRVSLAADVAEKWEKEQKQSEKILESESVV